MPLAFQVCRWFDPCVYCSIHYKASGCSKIVRKGVLVQWSEDKIKADPFFGRSQVRFRVRSWVSNTIARDHLA